MGKFDGFMLCSDLDGTLLSDDESISEKNREAIEYFKAEGGIFTIVTGRAPCSSARIAGGLKPNAPAVVFNGAGIFDFAQEKLIWGEYLDERAKEVVRLVESKFPELGILVCTDRYYCVDDNNRLVKSYHRFDSGEEIYIPYRDIKEPWKKVVFIVDPENVEAVRRLIAESEYADDFSYMQSSSYYYEILPKGITKSSAIRKVCEISEITDRKILCMGDSENDVAMVTDADIGIAPKNALECVKAAADVVLEVTNNEDAIAEVIYKIL